MSFSRPSIVLKLFFVETFVQKVVVVFFVWVSKIKIGEQQSNTVFLVFMDKIRYFRSVKPAWVGDRILHQHHPPTREKGKALKSGHPQTWNYEGHASQIGIEEQSVSKWVRWLSSVEQTTSCSKDYFYICGQMEGTEQTSQVVRDLESLAVKNMSSNII